MYGKPPLFVQSDRDILDAIGDRVEATSYVFNEFSAPDGWRPRYPVVLDDRVPPSELWLQWFNPAKEAAMQEPYPEARRERDTYSEGRFTPAEKDIPRSGAQGRVESLWKQTARLEETLASLYARLEPLLIPDAPRAMPGDDQTAVRPSRSPMLEELERLEERFAGHIDGIERLLSRLEI